MKIEVLEGDWGNIGCGDIRKLLEDVASHIVRELRDPFDETIHVVNLPGEQTPRALFREPGDATYRVNLTTKGPFWSQFAYQFGHEFCHVLSGHDRLRCNPNNWFHEALCELSSLFMLRRMAERWPTNPPYPNWRDFSASLAQYAQGVMDRHNSDVPKGPFNDWLRENQGDLRGNRYMRDKNGVVALRLLPVFERIPQGWNAVRCLPVITGPIDEYINAWCAEVQDVDRPFVECIGQSLLGQNPTKRG